MQHLLSITLALLLLTGLLAHPAAAQQEDSAEAQPAPAVEPVADTTAQMKAAREAAQAWLALADAEDYQQSWETAAQLLKDQVTQAQWAKAGQQVQSQTGALQSRSLVRSQYTTALPNLPEGHYVVLFYGSEFANTAGQEIVVMARENGSWKTAGYRVQPAGRQGQQQNQQQMEEDDQGNQR